MSRISGNQDQRFITEDDHDAARKWFERQKRRERGRETLEDRQRNLKRLREAMERVTAK